MMHAASSVLGYESDRRLRAGFIGCGDHAYRNVYPVLQWAPVELVAVCDRDGDRAEAYRRQFGALTAYKDHRDLLDAEDLDCVFIVTGYDKSSRTTHADLASDALERGVATWVEKPPVNSVDDVAKIRAAMATGGAHYAVGFKKAFAPANRRLKELVEAADFGPIRTLSLRYAQPVPHPDGGTDAERHAFFDNLGHPLSLLRLLGGRVRSLFYRRAETGAAFATFEMESGAVASLQFVAASSQRTAAERTEVNGDYATAVVENNMRVIYAPNPGLRERPGWGIGKHRWRNYGRDPDFTGAPADGYLVWEPEFSLGQLYNNGLFLQGYYGEIAEFCAAVLDGRPVDVGGIDYADEGIRLRDAFLQGPDRVIDLR
jgi:predicted dehydrogenase